MENNAGEIGLKRRSAHIRPGKKRKDGIGEVTGVHNACYPQKTMAAVPEAILIRKYTVCNKQKNRRLVRNNVCFSDYWCFLIIGRNNGVAPKANMATCSNTA
ncbi:hypothetical protein EYF80_011138 [Liparis tanakae]|uniref:Uncharacterized protein n=1 Tax=Liparis tanakae TaxID=230148 RepID=A0A4Z2IN12_9TELE|nr:hypothetical protein EYF80_011138 [Liparis tanakae]